MCNNQSSSTDMSANLPAFYSANSKFKLFSFLGFILAVIFLISLISGCTAKESKPRGSIHTLPSFSFLLLDTVTQVASTQMGEGSPIILMYFDPACSHCQFLTKMIKKNIDSFENIRIYLLTPSSYEQVKYFSDAYHLNDYKSITVGTDYKYSFYKAFKPTALPYVAIYDAQKHLVKELSNGADVRQIILALHS